MWFHLCSNRSYKALLGILTPPPNQLTTASRFAISDITPQGFTGKTSLDRVCHLDDRLFDNLF